MFKKHKLFDWFSRQLGELLRGATDCQHRCYCLVRLKTQKVLNCGFLSSEESGQVPPKPSFRAAINALQAIGYTDAPLTTPTLSKY